MRVTSSLTILHRHGGDARSCMMLEQNRKVIKGDVTPYSTIDRPRRPHVIHKDLFGRVPGTTGGRLPYPNRVESDGDYPLVSNRDPLAFVLLVEFRCVVPHTPQVYHAAASLGNDRGSRGSRSNRSTGT